MEKSVKIIGKNKWQTLSSRQKHEAIARFACECLETGNYQVFRYHYDRLISWSPIDRFESPAWLSESECLENYFSFHQSLSGKPIHFFRKRKGVKIAVSWSPKYQITVALDQVLTPFNIGSILRVIDNFGLAGLVHSTAHLDLSHPQLKKAARGTENWIPVRYEKDLPVFLRSAKIPVIGLEYSETSIKLNDWKFSESFIIVLGNEAYGISNEILRCCDQLVYIPMNGFKNSMNLSHALAVAACYIR